MLKIKVCGMTDGENIRQVEALGIDMMGFIFYPKSPRCVARKPEYLPERCARTGVFVNASIDEILGRVSEYHLAAVQLHGSETPDFCRTLRQHLPDGTKIIKAFSVKEVLTLSATADYEGIVDIMLFDTPCSGFGGSGKTFDWSLLAQYTGTTPFLLSGGISEDACEEISRFHHPQCIGIDLNSRFETAPGIKNTQSLNNFIKKIHELS